MRLLLAATAATVFATDAASALKPNLKWAFSGTLKQTGHCYGPASAQRPSCADVDPGNSSTYVAADENLNGGTIVSEPTGDFNDRDFVSFNNLDDYQVTPFFNESVCYLLAYQAPGGGQMLAKFKPAIYNFFGLNMILEGQRLQFEVYYADAIANGATGSVGGHPCTVYRYNCAAHPSTGGDCEFVDFCVSTDGHLMQLNSTSLMGTADPNVKLTLNTLIQVEDMTPNPPASTFDLPVDKSDCLNLKSAEYSTLSAEQQRAHSLATKVNDQARIHVINTEANGWTAGESTFFNNWTLANTTVLTKADWRFGSLELADHYETVDPDTIPESFDARTQWKSCKSIHEIRNQGQCGSCWAFAAMESLADRFCVSNPTKYSSIELSAQYAMGCDLLSHGCNGGYIDQIWEYLRDHGTAAETCVAYQHCKDPSSSDCGGPSPPPMPGSMDTCQAKCDGGESIQLYQAASAYMAAKPGDVAGIQAEIMAHGPLEVGYYVFSDFQNYQSGVYQRTASAQGPTGKHAVKLVGWGTEGGTDYWIVANSWSPQWGEDGFFRIARGQNECGIEMVPAAGLPAV